MATFTLHQVASITDGLKYRVSNEVTSAVDAPLEVFVFKTVNCEFSHCAMPADIDKWPDSYEAAILQDTMFYRQASVTRDWKTVRMRNDDLLTTQGRLQLLANELTTQQGALTTDVTVVIEGSSNG